MENNTPRFKKHMQHTLAFKCELDAPNRSKLNPIRESDMTWKFGKWQGTKLSDLTVSYLNWSLRKMNLSDTARSIIERELALRSKSGS